jgi:hypothetical protein
METFYPNNDEVVLSPYVVPKHSLRRNQKELMIIEALVKYLCNFKNKMLLNKCSQTLLLMCNHLEAIVCKKDKINKKDVIIAVYKQVFGADVDLDFLEKTIEFLWENKKIKGLSAVKKYVFPFANFFSNINFQNNTKCDDEFNSSNKYTI